MRSGYHSVVRPIILKPFNAVGRPIVVLFAMIAIVGGCKSGSKSTVSTTLSTPAAPGLLPLTANMDLDACVAPPVGWLPDPVKASSRHRHQVWISPSGHTAYGVIRFTMPVPIGHDLALWGFMNQMKRTEGESRLISREWDSTLAGMRFVAEGGLYLLRTNLFVRGFSGWAVYSGTLRGEPIDTEELKLSESAREHTKLGTDPLNAK